MSHTCGFCGIKCITHRGLASHLKSKHPPKSTLVDDKFVDNLNVQHPELNGKKLL
jgi:hypothetical protein